RPARSESAATRTAEPRPALPASQGSAARPSRTRPAAWATVRLPSPADSRREPARPLPCTTFVSSACIPPVECPDSAIIQQNYSGARCSWYTASIGFSGGIRLADFLANTYLPLLLWSHVQRPVGKGQERES